MGKILDEIERTATRAPWLTPVDPLRAPKGSLQRHVAGKERPLPAPYHRRRDGCHEADLLKETQAELKRLRVWHRRIDASGKIRWAGGEGCLTPGSNTGLPDVLACIEGRLVGIECKAPGGKVSAVQLATLKELADSGARVCLLVDPTRLEGWLSRGECVGDLEGVPVV
jgi:hypothetical protein